MSEIPRPETAHGGAVASNDVLVDKLKLDQSVREHLFPDCSRFVIATWHWTISGSSGYSARSSADDIKDLLNEMASLKKGRHDFKLYDNDTGKAP